MTPKLAPKDKCTGCGACKEKCAVKCIDLVTDECDNVYPEINSNLCVGCGQCVSACPALNNSDLFKKPLSAYASWSNDDYIRKHSASGGVAVSMYKFLMSKGWICYGVSFDEDFNAVFGEIKSDEDIEKCRNSKYVFSDFSRILNEVGKYLNSGKKVFAVGLPCQIAGLRKYLGKDYDNLLTADLLCHGVCSPQYLKQHISYLEEKCGGKCHKLYFRNPKYGTENCSFTLTDSENQEFYNKKVNDDDVYQIGYHKAVIYRENCYKCDYATQERVGDLTLGDYWLIGKEIHFGHSGKKVSLVLTQTQKGKGILEELRKENLIFLEERPLSESVKVQEQLREPSKKRLEHDKFVKIYGKTKNFESSAFSAVKGYIFFNKHGLAEYYGKYLRLRYKLFKR